MIDPYSNNRDSNPYAYYEEDTSVRPIYHSGGGISYQEPRTPLIVRLERIHFFTLLPKTYQLVVMRDYCELVVNDRATDIVLPRSEALDNLTIRKNFIAIINENGRKYKFLLKPESFGEIKQARLALWCQEECLNDPLAAYRAVRDLMFDHFFASLFGSAKKICIGWVCILITMIIILMRLNFYNISSFFNLSVVIACTIDYVTITGIILNNRRAVFSSAMILVLTLPFATMLPAFLIFPEILILVGLAVTPAFWLGCKILAFRGTISKLREDNAGLFTAPKPASRTPD